MPSDALASVTTEEFHDPSEAICVRTGRNLRRLRTRRGYSLDRLAKVSGVSRAMLGQIETGKSSPTLNVLAKIAAALEVSCGSLIIEADEPTTVLLTRAASKTLSSSDGRFETRALFPMTATARSSSTNCASRRTTPNGQMHIDPVPSKT